MSSRHHDHHEIEPHDLGLSYDLPKIVEGGRAGLGRCNVFGLVRGLGVLAVAGGASESTTPSTLQPPAGRGSGRTVRRGPPDGGGAESSVAVAEGEIPEETAGPFPVTAPTGPTC